MKKILVFALLSFSLLSSCSSEPDVVDVNQTEFSKKSEKPFEVKNTETGEVLYGVFESDSKKAIDFSKPKMYTDPSLMRPVSVGYWECGAGVYTNGSSTYHIRIANCGSPNVFMQADHFSQTVYCFTTHWGGTCGSW